MDTYPYVLYKTITVNNSHAIANTKPHNNTNMLKYFMSTFPWRTVRLKSYISYYKACK